MDREFFSVDVVRVFFDARRRFLMPATRTDGIKAAIAEHAGGGRGAVSRYVMRSSEGAEATVTLIIARSKHYDDKDADILDRYVPFVTNLSARRGWIELCTLPEEYRRRCGIETAYRQIGEARPKTISRDHTLRMILFYVALFMYNAWAVENRPSGPEAGIKLAQVLVAIYNASGPAGTGPGPPEKFG